MPIRDFGRVLVMAGLAATGLLGPARAQSYPERPIALVVGQSAGGTSDIYARLFAQVLGAKLGKVVVENVTGAGGTIAAARVARAQPDGYTLLLGSSGINAIAYSQYRNLPYKPEDFVPIARIVDTWIVIATRKSFGAKNLQEFIAMAKARPDEITMGHTGKGQTTHLGCVLLEQVADVKLRMVAFRGGGDALNALLGGNIDGVCSGATGIGPSIQEKNAIGLVVAADERIKMVPDVPSAKEAKLPGLSAPVWITVFAPAGTPPEIVGKLNGVFRDAMADPVVAEALEKIGSAVPPESERSVEAAERLVRSEIKRWAEVLQRADLTKE